jgi:hypothetical protein
LTPTGTETGDWPFTTPSQSASNHHLNVDEGIDVYDDADFVEVRTGGVVDEFQFGTFTNTGALDWLKLIIRRKAVDILNVAGAKFQIFLDAVAITPETELVMTGDWASIQITTLAANFTGGFAGTGAAWNAATTRTVRITSTLDPPGGTGGGDPYDRDAA